MTRNRRAFLKSTGAAVSAAAVGACAPSPPSPDDRGTKAASLDAVILGALGEVVLPA